MLVIAGVTRTQNSWLAGAVKQLNDLVVLHAEEAIKKGDEDEVIRAVNGLGEWAFRLNDDQKRQLIVAVEAATAKLS